MFITIILISSALAQDLSRNVIIFVEIQSNATTVNVSIVVNALVDVYIILEHSSSKDSSKSTFTIRTNSSSDLMITTCCNDSGDSFIKFLNSSFESFLLSSLLIDIATAGPSFAFNKSFSKSEGFGVQSHRSTTSLLSFVSHDVRLTAF